MPQQAKPNPQHEEQPLAKNLLSHVLGLLALIVMCKKSIKTHSSSLKVMASTSQVDVHAGAGEALAASWISCSRKVSKSKVVGHKSLGSPPRFPPPITKDMEVDKSDKTATQVIRKPPHFSQQHKPIPEHLLDSSGPGDHGKAAPNFGAAKAGSGAFTKPNGFR